MRTARWSYSGVNLGCSGDAELAHGRGALRDSCFDIDQMGTNWLAITIPHRGCMRKLDWLTITWSGWTAVFACVLLYIAFFAK
jgi:hypothetical protein